MLLVLLLVLLLLLLLLSLRCRCAGAVGVTGAEGRRRGGGGGEEQASYLTLRVYCKYMSLQYIYCKRYIYMSWLSGGKSGP